MDFKNINYAGGTAHMVICKEMLDAIVGKLQTYYHLQLFKPYRKTYLKLTNEGNLKHDYLIRYMLNIPKSYIYTTVYNGVKLCFHIVNNQDITLYSVKHRFSEDLFNGDMLLEGTLIDDMSPIFLVDDIIIYDGCTVELLLDEKLKLLNEIIDTKYRPDPVMDPCTVILADHIEANYFCSFMETYLHTLSYAQYVNGIVLVPLTQCQTNLICNVLPPIEQIVLHNIKHNIVVEKPKLYTFCFNVAKTDIPDVYQLYIGDGTKLNYYEQACVPDKETSLRLRNIFKTKNFSTMTCYYNNVLQHWIPHAISSNKTPDDIKNLIC